MKRALFVVVMLSILLGACGQGSSSVSKGEVSDSAIYQTNIQNSATVLERFSPPSSYRRTLVDSTSFSFYLRNLPLKPKGTPVKYYNGKIKNGQNVYEAVVDLQIGKRDLHQCADAIIRLRAEYLFKQEKFDSIHFNFTNGFKADYSRWKKGNRISVQGNTVFWKHTSRPSNDYQTFWNYLEMVFSYAGTASLEKEMKSVSLDEMKIGDVFIQGGFPGHAVIIVEMAENKSTGKKIFLLAQSYMPAQEIQILKNPNDSGLSPWYSSDISSELKTPEWVFTNPSLKRFSN